MNKYTLWHSIVHVGSGVCVCVRVRDSVHSASDELLSENISLLASGSAHMATITNE